MKDIPPGMLEEIVSRLVETLHPLEIYLFGSHAGGTPYRHSDVDILVVVPDGVGDRHELATRGDAALWGLPVPVDIIVFHRSEMDKWAPVRLSLPGTVSRYGKRLYVA
jgi:predicted nucleotidyltransferase